MGLEGFNPSSLPFSWLSGREEREADRKELWGQKVGALHILPVRGRDQDKQGS